MINESCLFYQNNTFIIEIFKYLTVHHTHMTVIKRFYYFM